MQPEGVAGGWERIDLSDPKYQTPSAPPVICKMIYERKRHAFSGPPDH